MSVHREPSQGTSVLSPACHLREADIIGTNRLSTGEHRLFITDIEVFPGSHASMAETRRALGILRMLQVLNESWASGVPPHCCCVCRLEAAISAPTNIANKPK
jgi:hypothetical protein